jgi:hypothetical protein
MVDFVPIDHNPFLEDAPPMLAGREPQGFLSKIGQGAVDLLNHDMLPEPAIIPSLVTGAAKGFADTARMATTPPPALPAGMHVNEVGNPVYLDANGREVPWHDIDPQAAEAYGHEMLARRDLVPSTAMSMLGGGAGFAERGALGSAGAKMVQPAAEAQPGIRAYHGSPHDFNQFDTEKIGTGEGAQSYGHGLYFSEHPNTAESYRRVLGRDHDAYRVNGDVVEYPSPEFSAANQIKTFGPDIAFSEAKKWGENHPQLGDVAKVLMDWEKSPPQISPGRGRMYEVNIAAHPDQFMHWDKSLGEQTPYVQERLRKIMGDEAFDRYAKQGLAGYDLHRDLKTAGVNDFNDPAIASRALNEHGIPGIKYLDQGSRDTGEGTHNFVVFDPKLIDIVKKYGIAGLGAFPAGAHFLQQVDSDPFAKGHASGGRVKPKLSHKSVGYVSKSSISGKHCAVCSMFQDGACSLVSDPISPAGWCRRFTED